MSKILIVEDDVVLAKMYARKFEHEGFEVLQAYTGGEGLQKAKTKPDLIVLDIMMPQMDGFTVIQNLKKDELTKKIPIVILTNLGTSEVFVEEAKRLGIKHYLVKYKTSTEELIKIVNSELEEG